MPHDTILEVGTECLDYAIYARQLSTGHVWKIYNLRVLLSISSDVNDSSEDM